MVKMGPRAARAIAASSACRAYQAPPVHQETKVLVEAMALRASPESPDLEDRLEWTATPVCLA